MTQSPTHSVARHGGLPKPLLLGAAALIGFSFLAAATAHYSGVGRQQLPEAQSVETLRLSFEDQDDGSILVRNAATGAAIYSVAPGTNGFIRATLRGLARERRRSGLDAATPFLLGTSDEGVIWLEDPATGRRIGLNAFGPTNAGAFAEFFAAQRRSK
jgi:putative photosynthetic complex assembly protein